MFKSMILLIVSLFSVESMAAAFLPLYQGSVLLDQNNSLVENHHIGLSKNKKVDGRWRFEREQKISGVLSRKLYEISSEDSYLDIAGFYSDRINGLAAEVLFHCQERLCGSSNEWANGMFRDSRLYGPDNKQYYWVLMHEQAYWVIYLVERGNRRVHFYVEQLQPFDLATLAALPLAIPCEHSPKAALTAFTQDPKATYIIFYNVGGFNTASKSQQLAEQCLAAIKRDFPAVDVQALGLGEFDRSKRSRLMEDKVELIRLDRGS